MRGGGQPLPASERAFFEPRFERDFNHVRIHSDTKAAAAAKSANAAAFTVGSDIFFRVPRGEGGAPFYALSPSDKRIPRKTRIG